MEYTIQKLANLAGVSSRTLRYYDEIGLLKPARVSSNGYRIYGQEQVDLLQQILFYREMEVSLPAIKEILANPEFDEKEALKAHHAELLQKEKRLKRLINTVEKTLQAREGKIMMSNQEKFEAFKEDLIAQNEQQYGSEIREKYGEAEIEKSNQKVAHMSEADYEKVTQLEAHLVEVLKELQSEVTEDLQHDAFQTHKAWLGYFWPSYSEEAHLGIVEMYLADERFTAYYDEKAGSGAAKRLHDAVQNELR
ncbi:MerR family transcriptional regulator [Listeria kieliensis]|uniref:MerR family transcriptional regulator n=1 Tax=Listeria kieliensis TaxID=1621700 RepID=A0A3D8TJN3_9LIST|nr:MerR family transcriptional regulator [Listeria kieliensis]RDW99106.1 MerR family transcriptional regulator [Listeria kieliensis]